MNMIDGTEETCWNSDRGHGQYVHVAFNSLVKIQAISLTFQGGFCGQDCRLLGKGSLSTPFFPADSSLSQNIDLSKSVFIETSVDQVRIVFDKSTDMFGRIVIYKLDLFGICSI